MGWQVRGHWRNQAQGKGLNEKTPQFKVEPYWKGREFDEVFNKEYEVK